MPVPFSWKLTLEALVIVGAVPSYVYVKEAEPVLEFPAASVNAPSAIDMDLDPSPLGVNVAV